MSTTMADMYRYYHLFLCLFLENGIIWQYLGSILFFFFFFFFVFLGPHVQHMEVPKLGTELEPQTLAS